MGCRKARPFPDFVEFIIGPAGGRTRWLHPGYGLSLRLRGWVRAGNLLATAPKPDTLRLILKHQAACTSPGADIGAAERHAMDDEGRGTGGLEPAPYRQRADSRAYRGRGHHFRHRRAPNPGAAGRATFIGPDLRHHNLRPPIAPPPRGGFPGLG